VSGDFFDIFDQVVGRVVVERAEWQATAATALVKKDNALLRRIKARFVTVPSRTPRPTVQENDRLHGCLVAPVLHVELVAVADVKY